MENNNTLEILEKENYGKRIPVGKKHSIKGYSHKQLHVIYPQKRIKIVGECLPHSRKKAAVFLTDGQIRLPLHKRGTFSRWLYRPSGYVELQNAPHRFVVFLKSSLPLYLAVFCSVILFTAGGILAVPYITGNSPAVPGMVEIDEGVTDYTGSLPQADNEGASGIRIPGYKSITIQANTEKVKVNFVNPQDNNCYFVMKLVLLDDQGDTAETLYQSKMVPPGKCLSDIQLTRKLKPGIYNAQLQYEPYRIDGMQRLNGAAVDFQLVAA